MTLLLLYDERKHALCYRSLEVEQLRQEKLEIDQQLRNIHGSSLGSMQSLSMNRRNDRGYHSDVDGGSRPGRGGMMRGRGGRGRGRTDRYNSGSRHQTPDTIDERIHDPPPRYYGSARGRGRRENRRDDRRRTTDDEETVLDSQDISTTNRVNNHTAGGIAEVSQNDKGSLENISNPQRDVKSRSNRLLPSRRTDPKPKEPMVNGTTV
ncbi:hypothetical protein JTB14_036167 [Gonioctena quinquepunctata]|nr:hypothetical protein JTB14_036167 [Gonioctena quinquepunctata]